MRHEKFRKVMQTVCGFLFLFVAFLFLDFEQRLVANMREMGQYAYLSPWTHGVIILAITSVFGMSLKCFWAVVGPYLGFHPEESSMED
jgi:hypothetical protein